MIDSWPIKQINRDDRVIDIERWDYLSAENREVVERKYMNAQPGDIVELTMLPKYIGRILSEADRYFTSFDYTQDLIHDTILLGEKGILRAMVIDPFRAGKYTTPERTVFHPLFKVTSIALDLTDDGYPYASETSTIHKKSIAAIDVIKSQIYMEMAGYTYQEPQVFSVDEEVIWYSDYRQKNVGVGYYKGRYYDRSVVQLEGSKNTVFLPTLAIHKA